MYHRRKSTTDSVKSNRRFNSTLTKITDTKVKLHVQLDATLTGDVVGKHPKRIATHFTDFRTSNSFIQIHSLHDRIGLQVNVNVNVSSDYSTLTMI